MILFEYSAIISFCNLLIAVTHKNPVIIMPYYEKTREQELIEKLSENFNMDYIRIIHSVNEI